MNDIRSVYVIGESRTNADNAITKMYGSFYMAFEVEDVTNNVEKIYALLAQPFQDLEDIKAKNND